MERRGDTGPVGAARLREGVTVYFLLFLFEERQNERKMKGRKG